jgi:hypothetical protein
LKPTQEQIERLKAWLDTRLSALFAGEPFPRLPRAIEDDLKNGVEFADIFREYGFAADGFQLLPNFFETQRKTGRAFRP